MWQSEPNQGTSNNKKNCLNYEADVIIPYLAFTKITNNKQGSKEICCALVCIVF